MKRRSVLALVLVAAFLLPGGAAPVIADGMSGVTGGIGLEPPNWGNYYRVWIEFNIHQVDPATYDADGMIHAQVYTPPFGWKRLWYEAECVSFGEVDGNPSAILVAKIVRREGWDDIPTAGDPGEYLKWQLIDGGTPASNGDTWPLQWYDLGNWIEYWPTYPDGGCNDFRADETDYLDYGNLVIH